MSVVNNVVLVVVRHDAGYWMVMFAVGALGLATRSTVAGCVAAVTATATHTQPQR